MAIKGKDSREQSSNGGAGIFDVKPLESVRRFPRQFIGIVGIII
jgi:hypothetical protein